LAALEFLFDRAADFLSVAPRALLGSLAAAFIGFHVARGPGAIAGLVGGLVSGLYFDISESPTAIRFRWPFLLATIAILAIAIAQWIWR
jgi:hypothetical protein